MTEPSDGVEFTIKPQWLNGLSALAGNIAAGFRLALFRRARAEMFSASVNQAGFALIALFLSVFVLRFLANLPYPEFNSYGLSFAVTAYVCMVFGLWLIALFQRSSNTVALLTVMMANASITTTIIYIALSTLVYGNFIGMALYIGAWAISIGIIVWTVLIALRVIRIALGTTLRRSFVLALFYVIIAYTPLTLLPYQQMWFDGADQHTAASEVSDYQPIDVERTFYAQQAMVGEALDRLEPSRPGVTDLYFLGFAGYGSQDVFMNEVKVANSLFDQQFDTKRRSLALINNRQTIDDLPLANISNKRLALNGLAKRMDHEEDVLFLFLTSHGSRNRFSTSFWPLQHNDLEPAELRSMLDEARIGWRVIVLSACYSGSFVDELRSERTLVITASREDRSSFGCSDEADMTYFGRALIDKALRKTRSFTTAYDLATESVAAREKADGLTPSEPQISVGSEIAVKLAALTDRLELLREVAARD